MKNKVILKECPICGNKKLGEIMTIIKATTFKGFFCKNCLQNLLEINHLNLWSDYMNKADIHFEIVKELNNIYRLKNNDYGDSFKAVRDKYNNAILIRLNDKLNRLETLMLGKEQKVNNESIEDTLKDLANYAIMELIERKIEREG